MTDPSTSRPPTARGRKTRRKLLAAAESLFGEKGFHGTSIVDITREAGVGQGTFYLYFESKEEVFRQLVRHLSQQLRRALAAAVADAGDRIEVEVAGMREFIRFSAEHRDLYQIVSESQFIDPAIFRWYYERLARGYTLGLRRAMDRGEVEEVDPETLSYCLMGVSHFLGIRWVAWENREPPREVIESAVNFIRRALAPVGADAGSAPGRATPTSSRGHAPSTSAPPRRTKS